MRLDKEDEVAGVAIVREDMELIVLTEHGYGKKTDYSEFATKGRGGRGMAYLKITEKNGDAVRIASISKDDEIIVMALSGMIIRIDSNEVSKVGRATVGVRIVNLKEDDRIVDFAIISDREEENNG